MNRTMPLLPTWCAAVALAVGCSATPAEALPLPVAWRAPTPADVKAQAAAWFEGRPIDPVARAKAESILAELPDSPTEDELLVRVCQASAAVDPNAARLVAICSQPRGQAKLLEQAWLADGGTSPLFAADLRLLYARWLVHESMFDEAQEQLSGLAPADVVAPAALLFYQGVVSHSLLSKESGLKAFDELLQGPESSPQRYVALARLMQEDLKGLQDDTLDHVARRMEDIRRRLRLGRAGPKVREVEDGVIESLDKLIKNLEDQQQQQSSGAGGSLRSTAPAQDSLPMGGKGPGEVTKRNIGSQSGWGDLPPKEREEAMQQLGRDFPSHYRDVVEQYFRRMASEGEK